MEWRGTNTYQGVIYSKNDDSFSCNLFYLKLLCGMHVTVGVNNMLNTRFDCS